MKTSKIILASLIALSSVLAYATKHMVDSKIKRDYFAQKNKTIDSLEVSEDRYFVEFTKEHILTRLLHSHQPVNPPFEEVTVQLKEAKLEETVGIIEVEEDKDKDTLDALKERIEVIKDTFEVPKKKESHILIKPH